MSKFFQSGVFLFALIIGLTAAGCDDSTTTPTSSKTGTGLFKTEGTFSFASNKGNFTATGIFDTLMTNPSASGAFRYTEGNRTVVMVFAYNIVSQTNAQLVFSGVYDTSGATSAGSYSFAQSGSKIAVFGYVPNIMDTSSAAAFYVLTSGSMNFSTMTTTATAGTFAGSGFSLYDTTKTISVTNGTFNTPVVEQYYGGFDESMETLVKEKIKAAIRREFQ